MSSSQKLEQRAIIKFLTQEEERPTEIFKRLESAYGANAIPKKSVFQWAKAFRNGRQNLEDVISGRPLSQSTGEYIPAVEKLIVADNRMTLTHISNVVGINRAHVARILNENLKMTKTAGRWTAKMIDLYTRNMRVEFCKMILSPAGPKQQNVIFGGEVWFYDFELRPQQRSNTTESSSVAAPTSNAALTDDEDCEVEPQPKKSKDLKNVEKVLAHIYWDAKGILLLTFKPQDVEFNSKYQTQVLEELGDALQKKRDAIKSRILIHELTPINNSLEVRNAIRGQDEFQDIFLPTFSPDLSIHDIWLIDQMKVKLRGRKYESAIDITEVVATFLGLQNEENYFTAGINLFYSHCGKCLQIDGNFIAIPSNLN